MLKEATIAAVHEQLEAMEAALQDRGLRHRVDAHIDWIGDAFEIKIEAYEDVNRDTWRKNVTFKTEGYDLPAIQEVFHRAWEYIEHIPDTYQRASETGIRILSQLKEVLPKNVKNQHLAFFIKAYQDMLQARIEELAENIIMAPKIEDEENPKEENPKEENSF